MLLGLKADLIFSKKVDSSKARAFATRNGLSFIETSAKLNQNVEAAFKQIVTDVQDTIPPPPIPTEKPHATLDIDSERQAEREKDVKDLSAALQRISKEQFPVFKRKPFASPKPNKRVEEDVKADSPSNINEVNSVYHVCYILTPWIGDLER